MAHFVKNLHKTGDIISNLYTGIDLPEMKKKLQEIMLADGYVIKEEAATGITLVKGNRVMRILFGAFVKYFKFTAILTPKEEGVVVTINKQTSGMSGGLIGMNQVKKEMERINMILSQI